MKKALNLFIEIFILKLGNQNMTKQNKTEPKKLNNMPMKNIF